MSTSSSSTTDASTQASHVDDDALHGLLVDSMCRHLMQAKNLIAHDIKIALDRSRQRWGLAAAADEAQQRVTTTAAAVDGDTSRSISNQQPPPVTNNNEASTRPGGVAAAANGNQRLVPLNDNLTVSFCADMWKRHPHIVAALSVEAFSDRVALCGGSVSRFVRSRRFDVDAQYDFDLFVYGATREQRLEAFRGVINALVRSIDKMASEQSPVYVLARRGVWTLTHATWSRPVQVILTDHATLADVLWSFDLDASRLAWRFADSSSIVTVNCADHVRTMDDGVMRNVDAWVTPTRLVKYIDMGWTLTEGAASRLHELVAAFGWQGDRLSSAACSKQKIIDIIAPMRTRAVKYAVAPVPCGAALVALDRRTVLTLLRSLYPNAAHAATCVWKADADVAVDEGEYRSQSRDGTQWFCAEPHTGILRSLGNVRGEGGVALELPMFDGQTSDASLTEIDDDDAVAADHQQRHPNMKQLHYYCRAMRRDQSMAALFVNLSWSGTNKGRTLTPTTAHYRFGGTGVGESARWRAPLMRIAEARVVAIDATTSEYRVAVTIEFGDAGANSDHVCRRAEWQYAVDKWLNDQLGFGTTRRIDFADGMPTGQARTATMLVMFTKARAKVALDGVKVGDWVALSYFVHHLWHDTKNGVWREEMRGATVKPLHGRV